MNLANILERKGISRTELSRRLHHKSPGLVSNVCQGKASIPLDKLDAWTEALGLTGLDAAEFRRLALAEQAPSLAKELAQLREEAGFQRSYAVIGRVGKLLWKEDLTPQEWMQKAGVEIDAYSRLLEDPDTFPIDELDRLAAVLGVSRGTILDNDPPMDHIR